MYMITTSTSDELMTPVRVTFSQYALLTSPPLGGCSPPVAALAYSRQDWRRRSRLCLQRVAKDTNENVTGRITRGSPSNEVGTLKLNGIIHL